MSPVSIILTGIVTGSVLMILNILGNRGTNKAITESIEQLSQRINDLETDLHLTKEHVNADLVELTRKDHTP